MKIHTIISGIMLTVISFIGLFCAGTSETGNALTVVGTLANSSGPVTCAKVHLVTDGYIPGKKTSGSVFTATTDETGAYKFTRIPSGDYYLNARKDSLKTMRGPITLDDADENDTKNLAVDTLKLTATLTMTIPANNDIATVFIEGSTESWDVNNGTVTLEYVPSGTVTISAITSKGTTARPEATTTVEVNPADTIATAIGNRPPVIVSPRAESRFQINNLNEIYLETIEAYDPESGSLIYELIDAPEGMRMDGDSGKISWQLSAEVEKGMYRFGVRVSDTQGGARSIWLNIEFNPYSHKDTTSPILTLSDTIVTILRGTEFITPSCQAFDQVDGDITNNVLVESNVNSDKIGIYYVEYSVSDAAGNTTTATVRVLVVQDVDEDIIAPVITLLGDNPFYIDTLTSPSEAELIDYYIEPGYTASDNKDGDITADVTVSTPEKKESGVWVITYRVEDAAGNSTSVIRQIASSTNIIEEYPLIELNGDNPHTVLLQSSTTYNEPGYTATDVEDGNITDKVTVVSTVDMNAAGEYTVTYTVPNSRGVRTQVVRQVHVHDNTIGEMTRPVITLAGRNPDTVLVYSSEEYIDPGVTAEDNHDGDITDKITVISYLNMNSIGKYIVTYQVKNAAGLMSTATRTVYVVRDIINDDLLVRYAAPFPDPIPATLRFYRIDGIDGINMDHSDIDSLFFNWNGNNFVDLTFFTGDEQIILYQHYEVECLLQNESPTLEIKDGFPIQELIGTYYVVFEDGEHSAEVMYWVEKNGIFAIIWKQTEGQFR